MTHFVSLKKMWMRSSRPVLSVIATGLATMLGQACLILETNPNYCSNINGDAFCGQRHEGEQPYCVFGSNACLAALPPAQRDNPDFDGCVQSEPIAECYSPCGGKKSQEELPVCFGGSEGTGTSGEESTSTGSSSTGGTTSEVSADGTSSSTGDESTSTGDASTGESTSSTTGPGSECGNNVRERDEDCDGPDLGGQDCATQGFDDGSLDCGDNCMLDYNHCITWECGNNILEGTEVCDEDHFVGEATCASLGFASGSLMCNGCTAFDFSDCSICGDGHIDTGETCDGTDFGGLLCTSLGLGFTGGTLACNAECSELDTTGCTTCSNNLLETGEVCDGTNLNMLSCEAIGFSGGDLACDAGCLGYDITGCYICGDGLIASGESCMADESCCSGVCNGMGICT